MVKPLHRLGLFFLLVLGLHGCMANFVYYPVREIRLTPVDAKLAYSDVTLETSDQVRIAAWWVPAAQARGTVLFCHGNGGNISYCLDSLRIFNRLQLNALIFDYRGYGRSQGVPSEKGTYLDAEAGWNYLVNERRIDPRHIIIWGRSLGGSIAAHTAALHPSGPVIIESAFTSVPDLAQERFRWLPSCILAPYRYDTRAYLARVTAPILIIHSPDDEIIPFQHGRRLYESLTGPKTFLEIKGSHNEGFIASRPVYEAGINTFINSHLNVTEDEHS